MNFHSGGTHVLANRQSQGAKRRQILGAAPLLAAAGALWKPTPASGQKGKGRGSRLVLDVACFGNTFRADTDAVAGGGDRRGASFFVEGGLYPQGTLLPGDGFDPSSASGLMMGHWLCRGWFMDHPGRPEPHVLTTQEYLLHLITASQPSPPDTLASSGVEGGIEVAHRAVIGGTGQYRHARGEVTQEVIGTNATVLPSGANAPNFRFYFDF